MKTIYRGVLSAVAVSFALVAACANQSAERVSSPATTSAECLVNGVTCTNSTDCCSMWCVNGYCEAKSP